MKLSDYIAEFLAKTGITHVFGLPGGAITHIIDSIYKRDDIRFIGTYHEQAAAFAAEGYARRGNFLGAAIATSGPGATNLITGIASAYFDSIPCLYITGQVNTYEYKGDGSVRQLGFQETDIVSIVTPVTKYAITIINPEKIRYELEKAVHIATGGRKGPVLIDIPMDIQRADISPPDLEVYTYHKPDISPLCLQGIVEIINASARPVILAGHGVRLAGAKALVEQFSKRLNIPVVSSLMGRDAFDNENMNYFGMIGVYGNRYANLIAANSDLVLALGTRLDSRQTGTLPSSFARGARLIRVDIDINELDRVVNEGEIGFNMDIADFMRELNKQKFVINMTAWSVWLSKARELKRRYPAFTEGSMKDPNYILNEISEAFSDEECITLDVGQNQMWAAQSLSVKKGRRLLISGGMGAMGFALPAAIGAYYQGNLNVTAIAGDGGMQVNIQELALIKRNKIPIKIIVLNNHSLGMIRQFQEMYFEGRYFGTVKDYQSPDFVKIAKAYGIKAVRVKSLRALKRIKKHLSSAGPMLIEIELGQNTYVTPKLAVNRPVEEQEPLLPREELEALMITQIMGDDTSDQEQDISSLVREFKTDRNKRLPIRDFNGVFWGYLRPISQDFMAHMPDITELLARWRNENMHITPERFTSTPASTKAWLEGIVSKSDRILFLVISANGQKVGHMGLNKIDFVSLSCEIDAVIRGIKQGYKGIMTSALNTLIAWALEDLKMQSVSLRVMSDNEHAIRFYENNCFKKHRDIPLVNTKNGWVEDYNGQAEKFYTQMELDIDSWKNKNLYLYYS